MEGWRSKLLSVPTYVTHLLKHIQTINFCFLSGEFQGTPIQQQKVIDICKEWEKYANVEFRKVEDQGAPIRITFNPNLGAWSAPGTDCKNAKPNVATMNIGPVTPDPEVTDDERGYVLHEFGHALGLYHEHQSPLMKGQWKEEGELPPF
jgi:hypothetical protein